MNSRAAGSKSAKYFTRGRPVLSSNPTAAVASAGPRPIMRGTAPLPYSVTRMGTAGCCRRSRLDCPVASEKRAVDVATLAEFLRETAQRHDHYKKTPAEHDW